MRVLPRTTRRSWLLATVLWMGMCAGGWIVTPVRPRTTVHLPLDSWPVAFGPNAEWVLVERNHFSTREETADAHALEVFSTSTSQSVATLPDADESTAVVGKSPDGQAWLLGDLVLTSLGNGGLI